jgi:hypothetical protein
MYDLCLGLIFSKQFLKTEKKRLSFSKNMGASDLLLSRQKPDSENNRSVIFVLFRAILFLSR